MDEYKEQAGAMVLAMCKKVHLMRSEIAERLGVNERTLCRWQNGTTSIDFAHYLMLVDLVNNCHTMPKA